MSKGLMKDLSRRLLTSALAIFILAMLIFFSQNRYFKPFFGLVIAAVSMAAIYEYINLARKKGVLLNRGLMFFLTFFQIFSFYIFSQITEYKILPLFALFIVFLIIFLSRFNEIKNSFEYVAFSSLGIFYIAIPLGLFLPIVYFHGGDGRFWLIFLLVVTKISDVGAYFGGKMFGKYKLSKNISPNKTVEGAVIGLAFSIITSCFFGYMLFSFQNVYDCFSPLIFLFLGAAIGILGLLGDLAESLFKRDVNVKDSNGLPGLGGILDMVDSLLFTTPFLFLFLEAV